MIDPMTFATVRLLSGALALLAIVRLKGQKRTTGASWISALCLGAYAIFFSLSYLKIDAGLGALILFGMVQTTMIAASLYSKLTVPGKDAPDLAGAFFMAAAGIAWGLYSLQGRKSKNPLEATAGNFLRATPLALFVLGLQLHSAHLTREGLAFALISGIVTSGLGYALWYTVLPKLSRTRAAVLQLLVPILAIGLAEIFIDENPSLRTLMCGLVILLGIATTLKPANQRSKNLD
jgi:drug/metabolite transporter (DMT)-like permease